MWIHNIDPVILTIWNIRANYYGLAYAMGFLIGFIYFTQLAKKKRIKGLTEKNADILTIYLAIGALVGARLANFVIFHPQELISDPIEIFRIWNGGMSSFGGIAGIIIATHLFCKKYEVKKYELLDRMAIIGTIVIFMIKMANFTNAELIGTPTTVSWCVVFPNTDLICRHPVQIYNAIQGLLLFATLLIVAKVKSIGKGIILWAFLALYGFSRFIIDFWKEDPRVFGISAGQTLALLIGIVATIVLYMYYKEQKTKKAQSNAQIR